MNFLDFDELLSDSQETALGKLLDSYEGVGLQATQVGRARRLVQEILFNKRRGDRVFVAYTSNLISSGLRDVFAALARERLVDGFLSTAGGVEEDVIKCLGQTLLAKFNLDGKELRRQGVNRIGNLIVPNDNYCAFEDFLMPVLKSIHETQTESQWSRMTAPSDYIHAMGAALESEHPDTCSHSLVYWCYKNDIPLFSPAITDGSIGDMIYFYNFSKKGLVVDPVQDVVRLRALGAGGTGANSCVILGAGLPKHHLLSNIAMSRVVVVTTGMEADGASSSCTLEDDRSCGLLSGSAEVVRVQGDATLIFPLLLARTAANPRSEQ